MAEWPWVKLWKSGDTMGIETNAIDEDAFLYHLSYAFDHMIQKRQFEDDWAFQMTYWLRQAVDIVCKLRGYKANCLERRILSAGHPTYQPGDLCCDTTLFMHQPDRNPPNAPLPHHIARSINQIMASDDQSDSGRLAS